MIQEYMSQNVEFESSIFCYVLVTRTYPILDREDTHNLLL